MLGTVKDHLLAPMRPCVFSLKIVTLVTIRNVFHAALNVWIAQVFFESKSADSLRQAETPLVVVCLLFESP